MSLKTSVLKSIAARQWSKSEAIRRADVNYTSVAKWLRGQNNPDLRTVEPLLHTLNIRIGKRSCGELGEILRAYLKPKLAMKGMTPAKATTLRNIANARRNMSVAMADKLIYDLGLQLVVN